MDNNEQLTSVLRSLQQAMDNIGHWSELGISSEALASQQPFCLDTMNFSQWLQFVFIPKIQVLIDTQQELPRLLKGQGIEPMAREFYKKTAADQTIIVLIGQLDDLLQG
jgi:uncharacterized protein YqcC (DUF446 family)